MSKNLKLKIKNSESGVSLIITFFVMIIVLMVVLSVSVLLYGQIKVVRNMGNSVASYYAGESGIEKVLFYDRRVLPRRNDENARGLCYMFDLDNPKYCQYQESNNSNSEYSKYCYGVSVTPLDAGNQGCNIDVCNNCKIIFSSKFDLSGKKNYNTTAIILPSGIFSIDSAGEFNSTSRKVNTTIIPNPNQ